MISEQNRKDFERLGVEWVKQRTTNILWSLDTQKAALEWLDEKHHGESRQHMQESLAVANSTKKAAWIAAIAAIVAAVFAATSIVVALIK